jgi:KaiC/GvpD/RAD55 family RecA-like ATPase
MPFTCLDVAKAASLQGGRKSGDELFFTCPRHDDEHPSLQVNQSKNTWLCGPCAAGGNAWQLAAFVKQVNPDDKPGMIALLKQLGLTNGNHSPKQSFPTTYFVRDLGRSVPIKEWYSYPDDLGAELFRIARVEYTNGEGSRHKDFPVWCLGSWGRTSKDVPDTVYRLPRLRAADHPFICEGEKDVETLEKLSLTATTNPAGAGKWKPEYSKFFSTKQSVVVLRDNDEAGLKHQLQILSSLHGKVKSLKKLELPGLPEKGDVTDWVELKVSQGRSLESIAEELCSLADGAPEWRPESETFKAPVHWKWLDVADIQKWEVTPLQPIIVGIIAAGNFVFVAAQSQTGKTLLFLYVARKIVTGGMLFDRFEIKPVEKVLYLVLEDPDRRIQERILDTIKEFPETAAGRFIVHVVPGFAITDPAMLQYLESLIRERRFQVVFLDTYQKATPGISSFNDEQQSVLLHKLANLTRQTGVTLIVIDHVRKDDKSKKRAGLSLDDIKGTGGKAQNADCVILMERSGKERAQIKFQAFSKDFDKPVGILLDVAPKGSDQPKFSYAGELSELGAESKKRGDATKNKLFERMTPGQWMTTGGLADKTGFNRGTVLRHIETLISDGKVEVRGDGRSREYRRLMQDADATVAAVEQEDLFSEAFN